MRHVFLAPTSTSNFDRRSNFDLVDDGIILVTLHFTLIDRRCVERLSMVDDSQTPHAGRSFAAWLSRSCSFRWAADDDGGRDMRRRCFCGAADGAWAVDTYLLTHKRPSTWHVLHATIALLIVSTTALSLMFMPFAVGIIAPFQFVDNQKSSERASRDFVTLHLHQKKWYDWQLMLWYRIYEFDLLGLFRDLMKKWEYGRRLWWRG